MQPEPFNGVHAVIKGPPDWPEDRMGPMHDIPAYVGKGLTMTTWRPSREEIALLSGGGIVLVTQVTTEPVPFQVEVMTTKQMNAGMAQA